jgi:hypothetical protein
MTPSAFSIPARFAPVAEPAAVFARLRAGGSLSAAEARQALDWLVYETRTVLQKALRAEAGDFNAAAADITTDPLHGRCSFAQCVAAYALLDRGLSPKPFSAQSLPGWHAGHATLALSLPVEGRQALYIVDPTYRQFCNPAQPALDGSPAPGFLLAAREGGETIAHALLRDGYIEASPAVADQYLAAFCRGVSPFASAQEAFAFLEAPPPDNGYACFDRRIMGKGGWLIRPRP